MKFCAKGIDSIEVLAPNGEPSILFEDLLKANKGNKELALEQYIQTKTQGFTKWFGNSYMLDKNNEPRLFFVENNPVFDNEKELKSLYSFESKIDQETFYQLKTASITVEPDAEFYMDGTEKLLRTNTLQQTFSAFARKRASRKIEDLVNYIVDKTWREKRLSDTDTLEEKGFPRSKYYTKEEYKQKTAKKLALPTLKGKAVHFLFASLDEKDLTRSRLFADEAEKFRVKAEIELDTWLDYKELYSEIKEVLNDAVTDEISNEVSFSIKVDPYEYTDKDGIKQTMSGYGGTIDRISKHADGTYTFTDFKTGSLQSSGDQYMNFAIEAGVKMLDTPLNRNVLNLTFYALMAKANNRSIRFRDLNFLKIDDMGRVTKLSSGHSFDFSSSLKLLKEYFKKYHYKFYESNQDLFKPSNYFAADAELLKNIADIKAKDNVSLFEARQKLIQSTIIKFREITQTRALYSNKETLSSDLKDKLDKANSEYEEVLQQLIELKIGYNPFKLGGAHYMDQLQAWFSNRYGQANPIVNSLNVLYSQAKNNIRTEFINIKHKHDLLLKTVVDEYYKGRTKKLLGADYEGLYSFMYMENKGRLDIVNYNNPEFWNKLTPAQKAYADFYRWEIRFNLFKTMKPSEGIEFIQKELDNRTSLSSEDRAYLTEQIKMLEKQVPYDKFKQSDYRDFLYYEGWTPRVNKTKEEADNLKEYISTIWKSNFISSDEELLNSVLPEAKERIIGLPLRFMATSEDTVNNHGDSYTFNAEIVFNSFVSHIITKNHMDDVYNIGEGIKHFMQEQDKLSNRELNKGNIEFVDAFVKGLVLGKKADTFNRVVRVFGANIDVDHAIRSLRSYFGVTTLALNVVGAVGTGINQSLKTLQMAATGSLGQLFLGDKANQDMDLKSARRIMKEIFKWKSDQIHGRINGKPEAATANKLALFLDMLGYLPKSYNYYDTGESHTRLVSKQGYIAPAWANNDLLLKLYSSVDNLNYAIYLLGQLNKMQTYKKDASGNKKLVPMWEAYEVKNGNLVYTGEARGVNALTNETISALTPEEIDKLRAFAERDLGSYREDERSKADNSSLGSLYMMFKRWLPALMKRSFSREYENPTLGKWMQSGNEIDPETNLPVMTWVPRVDEGFVWSLLKFLNIGLMAVRSMNAGTFREEFAKMSPDQKNNLIYALVKLGSFAALMLIMGAIFGDTDSDDQNKIKRMFGRITNETVFEFVLWDPEKWKDTLVSAPPIEKLLDTLKGYEQVIFRGLVPDLVGLDPLVVQSGDHEGWYKGITSVLRGTKYVSTMFGFWELGNSWESLEKDIDAARGQ